MGHKNSQFSASILLNGTRQTGTLMGILK